MLDLPWRAAGAPAAVRVPALCACDMPGAVAAAERRLQVNYMHMIVGQCGLLVCVGVSAMATAASTVAQLHAGVNGSAAVGQKRDHHADIAFSNETNAGEKRTASSATTRCQTGKRR